ncbi:MAG: DUF983 domain-containing protein [Aureispira sp.]
MFGKGSKLYSISRFKCPRCHEGDLYKTSLSSMQGIYNMHEECPHCQQRFEMEPGFYWGAMYIGYGLSSGYMLTAMVICLFAFGFTVNQSFAAAIAGGVIIVPLIARLARAIWINIYVKYKPQAANKPETAKEQ